MASPLIYRLLRPRAYPQRTRPAAAAYPPPRRPLPLAALLPTAVQAARTLPPPQSSDDDDDTTDDLGAYMRPFAPFRRPACRLERRGDTTVAVDEMGNEAIVMGEDFGADDFGMDDDDDFGEELGEDMGDDMGEDFGADNESALRARLAKLTYKYQSASGLFAKARKKALAKRIAKLKIKLAKIQGEKKASAAQLAAAYGAGAALGAPALSRTSATQVAAGVSPREAAAVRRGQAMNGLVAQYVAPPGSGRLVRLPFYGTVAPTSVPRTSFTAGVAGLTASSVLTTEDVSYAQLRIVGFVCQVSISLSTGAPSGLSQGFVEDLKVGGGANLFIHEQSADATQYDTDTEHLAGLRGYPVLRSPNRATVSASAFIGTANDVVVLSAAIVTDVLTDDVFGAGSPGPYAG